MKQDKTVSKLLGERLVKDLIATQMLVKMETVLVQVLQTFLSLKLKLMWLNERAAHCVTISKLLFPTFLLPGVGEGKINIAVANPSWLSPSLGNISLFY